MLADVTVTKIKLPPLGVESSRHVGTAPGGWLHGDVTVDVLREKARRSKNNRLYRMRHPEKAKASNRRYKQRWDLENREHRIAHKAVAYALRVGKLTQLPCSVCGDEDTHAHHEDYSRRLDVVWLCTFHHGERHREINASGGFRAHDGGFAFCRATGAVRKTLHIRRLTSAGACFDGGIDTDSLCGMVHADNGSDQPFAIGYQPSNAKLCSRCFNAHEAING